MKDTETIFDILSILDYCADTDSYRIVQVQFSRIKSQNYGLNFSDMNFLREFTELSYQVIFTEIK